MISAEHETLDLYVNGRWLPACTGASFEVLNPADGTLVGRVADGTADDVSLALDAAEKAAGAWQQQSAFDRAALLRRAAQMLRDDNERLSVRMTAEQGKPLHESRGEVDYAASFFDWFAGEAERLYGHTVPARRAEHRIMVLAQPIGMTAAITPWNFPAAMLSRKLGPALAAGCTCLVKPAEQTPLTAAAVVEALARAGLPDGVVNLVTTSRPAPLAEAIFADPRIRMVSFTGSTAVGKRLIRLSASHVVRLALELGGQAPYIIFDDADLDAAVAGVMASKFRNAGQTCVCANRVLVQGGVYDEFARRVTAATDALVVGPGDRVGVDIGPLINAAAVDKVERHVKDALDSGATLACGGRPVDEFPHGHFYHPTVLRDVSSEMLVSREETFGPVLALQLFDDERQVLALANDTSFGLAAYVHTRDLGRTWRVSEALDYGVVGVNEGLVSASNAPFGGVKESGVGREGGFLGIEEFVERKYVLLGGLQQCVQDGPARSR